MDQRINAVLQANDDAKTGAQPQPGRHAGFWRTAWNRWLKFAEVVGTVQMIIVLSLVYWTLVAAMAIPFRLMSDPLALKGPRTWIRHRAGSSTLDRMKDQY